VLRKCVRDPRLHHCANKTRGSVQFPSRLAAPSLSWQTIVLHKEGVEKIKSL
jgi:hypothetical protein